MDDGGFSWIYLIFFIFPLVRILPRVIHKFRKKDTNYQFESKDKNTIQKQESVTRPQNIEMQVLGEINRKVKDFNKIQRNLRIDNQELENILKKFEDDGLMKVVRKSGLFGVKIELHPTEKGFKKYYS